MFFAHPGFFALRVAALENPLRLLRIDFGAGSHDFEQAELAFTLCLNDRAVEVSRSQLGFLGTALHPHGKGVF